MTTSRFPAAARPAGSDYPAVTGYDVEAEAAFTPLDPVTCVFPAAGGLCTTAADLARFGFGWSSLLPRSLVSQALRPHARTATGARAGLGWMVNEPAGLAGLGGDGPGAAASLLMSLDLRHACAALASRQILIEHVNHSALRLVSGEASG
jgi:CubicO group peptidase (beta-lactamase class C family)